MIVAVIIGLVLALITFYVMDTIVPQLFAGLAALLVFVLCIGGLS